MTYKIVSLLFKTLFIFNWFNYLIISLKGKLKWHCDLPDLPTSRERSSYSKADELQWFKHISIQIIFEFLEDFLKSLTQIKVTKHLIRNIPMGYLVNLYVIW